MANKNHDTLKALLRNHGLPTAPEGFGDEVMREITAFNIEEKAGESRLKDVLQLSASPGVRPDFTDKVIDAIGNRGPAVTDPVIGKLGWISGAAFILICVIWGFFATDSHNVMPEGYTSVGSYIARVVSRYDEAVMYVIAAGPAAVLLLGIEKILKKRLQNKSASAY